MAPMDSAICLSARILGPLTVVARALVQRMSDVVFFARQTGISRNGVGVSDNNNTFLPESRMG